MFKNNVNLNLYKTFYDVARYGSFSKTAEFTYSTQSAISKSIKKLESELDTQLFYRRYNGIELTEKGRELLYYVEKSYGNLLTAERLMLERENLDRGKLSIGMPSNIGTFFLFDKVFDFHNNYPNIEISIVTGSTTYLLNLLMNHTIDFMIDTSPIKTTNTDINIVKLIDVDYVFISKYDTKYKEFNDIKSIKDLEDKPLILPLQGTNNRIEIDEVFYKNKVKINNVLNIHTSEIILNAVKKDLGIGYVIYDLVKDEINNKEYKKINIKEKLPKAEINLVYNKKILTTAPKTFIEKYIKRDI